jgi:hypothetical protein
MQVLKTVMFTTIKSPRIFYHNTDLHFEMITMWVTATAQMELLILYLEEKKGCTHTQAEGTTCAVHKCNKKCGHCCRQLGQSCHGPF